MKTYNTHGAFTHVEMMVKDRYSDPKYDNSIVMFGYNMVDKFHTFPFDELVKKEKDAGNKVIMYQMEQLYTGSHWVSKEGIERLSLADEVWDYDIQNIEFLHSYFDMNNIKLRPMLYSDSLLNISHLPDDKKDIDMLFYGSMNKARAGILSYIQKNMASAKIHFAADAWGDELESLIARSKIVLNIHYFPTVRQEQVRMFYLVSNGCCVVSQFSEQNYMGTSILNVHDEDMPYVCMQLLGTGMWKQQASISADRYKKISNEYLKRFV